MASAGFIYLQGAEGEQEEALVALLQACWAWLAARPDGGEGDPTAAAALRGILERADAVEFAWLTEADEVRGWPGGRVFGLVGELSWRRDDGLTQVVLVTDRDDLPLAFTNAASGNAGAMKLRAATDERLEWVQLWGKRQADGSWREARIPGLLRYPIAPERAARTAMLQVRRYIDADQPDTGVVDFVRYVDVK